MRRSGWTAKRPTSPKTANSSTAPAVKDLYRSDGRGRCVNRTDPLIRALFEPQAGRWPALLLLSAAPYKLYASRLEENRGAEANREFFDLLEFLGVVQGAGLKSGAQSAFAKFGSAKHTPNRGGGYGQPPMNNSFGFDSGFGELVDTASRNKGRGPAVPNWLWLGHESSNVLIERSQQARFNWLVPVPGQDAVEIDSHPRAIMHGCARTNPCSGVRRPRSDRMRKLPNLTDAYVGSRVQARRLAMSLSQSDLANRSGVTFQQIQKYERGTNRISAGRLVEFSQALQVPVSFFFEGGPLQGGGEEGLDAAAVIAIAGTPDGAALREAFMRINDKNLRRCIVALVEQVAEANNAKK
jgi:transcriptional regulator with XRE-family HTH domain